LCFKYETNNRQNCDSILVFMFWSSKRRYQRFWNKK
jgi:hypothetical protein